jgi:hypothetical protein
MTASILNSADIVSGGTFTAAVGTNRRVVFIGTVRKDTGTPTWAATFGGVAMTLDAQSAYLADDKLVTFSIAEASIPAGSQTLTVTAVGGTAVPTPSGKIYTLGGRDQTTVLDAGFTNTGNATAAASITTASLTNASHSCLLAAIRESAQDSLGIPSGWTLRQNYVSSALTIYDLDDAAAATATYTWTGTASNWEWLTAAYPAAASGGAALAATAAASSAVTDALSTQITLATTAASPSAATATLTNFASVVLTSPPYLGVGSIYDPNFWLDAAPVVGDTLFYDPKITVAANGEISSSTNPCQAVVQFNSG